LGYFGGVFGVQAAFLFSLRGSGRFSGCLKIKIFGSAFTFYFICLFKIKRFSGKPEIRHKDGRHNHQ
jgi:hypothetical protein